MRTNLCSGFWWHHRVAIKISSRMTLHMYFDALFILISVNCNETQSTMKMTQIFNTIWFICINCNPKGAELSIAQLLNIIENEALWLSWSSFHVYWSWFIYRLNVNSQWILSILYIILCKLNEFCMRVRDFFFFFCFILYSVCIIISMLYVYMHDICTVFFFVFFKYVIVCMCVCLYVIYL